MLSAIVAQYASHAPTLGLTPQPDVVGQEGIQGTGPYMKIGLSLCDGIIRQARFETYGCPVAIACGSWVTQWVEGRSVEEIQVLDAEDLIMVLGGVPLGKEHCAQLAVKALGSALGQAGSGQL